ITASRWCTRWPAGLPSEGCGDPGLTRQPSRARCGLMGREKPGPGLGNGYAEVTRSPAPNLALEPTPSSVRCAPAFRRGSPRALGHLRSKVSGRNSRKEHAIMSGRFHVVTWNGGGNTTPTYALARRLVARGHEVTLLGQSAQAGAVRDLGVRFVPLGIPDWTPGKSLEDETDAFDALLFGPAVGEAVVDTITQDAPDVLVVD